MAPSRGTERSRLMMTYEDSVFPYQLCNFLIQYVHRIQKGSGRL